MSACVRKSVPECTAFVRPTERSPVLGGHACRPSVPAHRQICCPPRVSFLHHKPSLLKQNLGYGRNCCHRKRTIPLFESTVDKKDFKCCYLNPMWRNYSFCFGLGKQSREWIVNCCVSVRKWIVIFWRTRSMIPHCNNFSFGVEIIEFKID